MLLDILVLLMLLLDDELLLLLLQRENVREATDASRWPRSGVMMVAEDVAMATDPTAAFLHVNCGDEEDDDVMPDRVSIAPAAAAAGSACSARRATRAVCSANAHHFTREEKSHKKSYGRSHRAQGS